MSELSIREALSYLEKERKINLSMRYLQLLCNKLKIKARKHGNIYFISQSDLDRWATEWLELKKKRYYNTLGARRRVYTVKEKIPD